MLLGFSFHQAMSGSYWLLHIPTDERAISFEIDAETRDVRAFARDKTFRITGTFDAERLACAKSLEGTLAFNLLDERRVAYRFAFQGDDGRRYELCGQEEWRGPAPIESLTLLAASLYDDRGEEIARATLRFDFRSDWVRWIRSFRLRWSP
jgi:hypothetical protein